MPSDCRRQCGQGPSANAAIAAQLRLAPKTVRNLTSALVTKLGVADRDAAVHRVRTVGGCR